jgi:7-cyano-7-deazaguanine synthase
MDQKKAVILLSGGLDSTTVLALATAEGYAVHALSVSYGQRLAGEIAASQ